ncbi:sodium-dependent multivitamin transporter [Caerostris extrusa]|uniref:Sodium-dependent multivitamin transporter n=1 Tax=Caerostris extrusa TaxID=172846 RepID=A0AAV4UB52_CAEEX|nr:sodium-dependent multivitamin transporter [Caerostris extrusa]
MICSGFRDLRAKLFAQGQEQIFKLLSFVEIVPYYIITRLNAIPGLTGVCVAGIFSGSLSTISSALNSLASVTVIDFLKPNLKSTKFSESKEVFIAKALSLFYGAICIGFTFLISKANSLIPISNTFLSMMEGPILAVYLIAVLTRKGSEKSILFGLILGFAFTAWLGWGVLTSGFNPPTLPIDTTGCPTAENISITFTNLTTLCENNEQCTVPVTTMAALKAPSEPFILYKISFLWVSTIGFVSTLIFILIAIVFTGRHNVIPADSKCLSPVARFWIKGTIFEAKEKKQSINMTERNLSAIQNDIEQNNIAVIKLP